jgi:iron complex outermembrane recepter protein
MRYVRLILLLLISLAVEARAELYGHVTDAATGAPVAGANVSAVGPVRGSTVSGIAAITDVEGRFRLPASADSIVVSHVGYRSRRVVLHAAARIALQPLPARMGEVVVRAGWTEQSLQQATSSVTVVASTALGEGRHLQDLTASIPNLNWAGGTSRPQYFQIRGIGERSNYAGEGPPSFSVGTVVDDVDLSGLGTGGLLFDLEQIEVYRGPQSTIFGANAMAGLIHMRSADPEDQYAQGLSAGIGSDGLRDVAGYVNVPVSATLALRAGYSRADSDGFRDNEYLQRNDTNQRQERVARLKALWEPAGGSRLTATWFYADADNGYDAWAPDNNEALHTYTDNPGVDSQRTTGLSLRAEAPLMAKLQLVSISAYSRTDGEYSFDSDWGHDGFWLQAPYHFDPLVEGYAYDFFDDMDRERSTWTQEVRLLRDQLPAVGGSAVLGLFARHLQEDAEATGYLFGGDAADLVSGFDISETALYGQHQRTLAENLQFTATLRADHNETSYSGRTNGGAESVRFRTGEWLTGGRMGVTLALGENRAAFATLSRGYRAGGINQHPRLEAANRPYDPEYVLNTEAGFRWAGARSRVSITAFHGRRSSQQVELSTQQDAGDPNSFVYFTNNAGTGWNAGVEIDGNYNLHSAVGISGSLGYLQTQVDEYTFATGEGTALTLGDRDAVHAPSYNLRFGVRTMSHRGPQAALEFTAMDGFFFSDSHSQRAAGYHLWNGSIGYRSAKWSLRLWGRNLLDSRYAVRGFYFGLEPPAYVDTLYVSYGDPRQAGLTVTAWR